MSARDRLLSSALGYSLWSTPLNRQKQAAISALLERLEPPRPWRILDVGCGPGTNADLFRAADYLGVDLNARYVAHARRKFPTLRFEVGDATRGEFGETQFDLVLINSVLHHFDDDGVHRCLTRAYELLRAGGAIAIQEPVAPARGQRLERLLERLDRGDYFRPESGWRELVARSGLSAAEWRLYDLRIFGIRGWRMVSALLRP